jgi:DNA-binding response OmpR family regulator
MRILAVEDDALILMSLAEMLEDLGHVVLRARSAREALALLAEEQIDLLLTDVGLASMSGVDLALEAVRQKPQLAIVFATGHTALAAHKAHRELARAILLPKPFSKTSLAAAIRTSS